MDLLWFLDLFDKILYWLSDKIFKSKVITNVNIINDCKKNLNFAEFMNLMSENKPVKKIKKTNKNKNKKFIWELKIMKKFITKKIPPVSGIEFLEVNFCQVSHYQEIRQVLLQLILQIKMDQVLQTQTQTLKVKKYQLIKKFFLVSKD